MATVNYHLRLSQHVLRHLVDEDAKSRPVEQNVVDLTHEVTSGRVVGHGPVHLGKVQSCAHGQIWQRKRQ
jgi:hypothetical protein